MAEHVIASANPIGEIIRGLIGEADIVLIIVGKRPGTTAPGNDISRTQTEYEMAMKNRKPVLVFVEDQEEGECPLDIDTEKRRGALVANIQRERPVIHFNSPHELTAQILSVLGSSRIKDLPPEARADAMRSATAEFIGSTQPARALSESFDITFAPNLSADQIQTTLAALADYFRACGGVGLQMDFDLADVLVEEPANVLA